MAVEEQRPPAAPPRPPADEPPRLGPLDLDAREIGPGRQLVERQPPVVDVEAAVTEVAGEVGQRVVLRIGPADAGDGHERGQVGQRLRRAVVEGIEDLLEAGRRHAPAR